MNEQRLIDLETKFSYQDSLIEELRQTLQTQYMTIDKLEKSLKALTDRFKEVNSNPLQLPHEKPPHY